MTTARTRIGSGRLLVAGAVLSASVVSAGAVHAQSCTALLGLFQQGRSNVQIARATGLTTTDVAGCRRELQRPIFFGPAGPPPLNAAGPSPRNPAGPPPLHAAGPPPLGAAGPPPLGAAGPPPLGAAGPPPVGREVRRLP